MTAQQCQQCGRTLTDAESIKQGCGPICADKKQQFVSGLCAEFGITAEQWAVAERINERWFQLGQKAAKAGRKDHARGFFKAAGLI